jgi:hypothetical protein
MTRYAAAGALALILSWVLIYNLRVAFLALTSGTRESFVLLAVPVVAGVIAMLTTPWVLVVAAIDPASYVLLSALGGVARQSLRGSGLSGPEC